MHILVTGGSSGIGLELVKRIVAAPGSPGATTVLKTLSRRPAPVEGCGHVPLDLASLRSVRACADELAARRRAVDVLYLNAGTMGITHFFEHQITEDGLDRCFQINFFGQAYLLVLLARRSLLAPDVTIVFVSSGAYMDAPKKNLIEGYATKSKLYSYGVSKVCMHAFLHCFAHSGAGVGVVCVDPGDVDTNIRAAAYASFSILNLFKRASYDRMRLISASDAAAHVYAAGKGAIGQKKASRFVDSGGKDMPSMVPGLSAAEIASICDWTTRQFGALADSGSRDLKLDLGDPGPNEEKVAGAVVLVALGVLVVFLVWLGVRYYSNCNPTAI